MHRSTEGAARHHQPGVENKTAQGRRQRKNRKSVNKLEGRQKPRRGRDRAGKARNTRQSTHPAHTNTKEPPPTPPPHPTGHKSTANHPGTKAG